MSLSDKEVRVAWEVVVHLVELVLVFLEAICLDVWKEIGSKNGGRETGTKCSFDEHGSRWSAYQ